MVCLQASRSLILLYHGNPELVYFSAGSESGREKKGDEKKVCRKKPRAMQVFTVASFTPCMLPLISTFTHLKKSPATKIKWLFVLTISFPFFHPHSSCLLWLLAFYRYYTCTHTHTYIHTVHIDLDRREGVSVFRFPFGAERFMNSSRFCRSGVSASEQRTKVCTFIVS